MTFRMPRRHTDLRTVQVAQGRLAVWGLFAVLGLVVFAASFAVAQSGAERNATLLTIDGPIGPAIADYIVKEIDNANAAKADVIVIEMDTPGGLDTSMRRIIKSILSSDVPVASYVSPSGARAASAGTYILYASHIAAMAPGTNLGAATPVQMGGSSPLPTDEKPDLGEPSDKSSEKSADEGGAEDASSSPAPSNEDSMRAKVINDATAYIKGLAELRGRNVDWAVKAVREAQSLPANEAAEMNVIDFVATNLTDLLAQADGRQVDINGEMTTIGSSGAAIERADPGWSTKLLAAVTHPNVAFLLMTIGFYGLFFELANPGSIFPGTFGLIALILGLYALSVLPVNMAGVALFGLGLILLIAEAFATSGGILGVAGLVAFAVGATMLFDTDVPGMRLSWEIILGATIVTGAFVAFVVMFALGAQTRRVTTGTEYLVRQKGWVESWEETEGWVIVEGERWRATCKTPLEPGQKIKVVALNGLMLTVAPV